MSLIDDAATALRQQYDAAQQLGPDAVISVGHSLTPPPAGQKFPVIDVTLAVGYARPAECASGFDYGGQHYRVRTFRPQRAYEAPLSV